MRKRIRSTLIRSTSGQSILEFVLVFPVVFLLVVNVVNFGGLLYAYITVANAARSGASYMIMGPSSAYAPNLPTASAIQDVVHADLGSLPGGTSDTTTPVSVCGIFNIAGTATPQWLTSLSPVTYTSCTMPTNPPTGSTYTDPQSSTDIIGTVQVQYTYCPFISGWSFPALGISTTLPACVTSGGTTTGGVLITRVAAMRVIQ